MISVSILKLTTQPPQNAEDNNNGRSISSACWEVIKRLKDVTLTGVKKEGQTTTQWTHVCIICSRLLRLTYHQHKKVWLTTQATTHIKKFGCHQKARLSFKHKDNTKQQLLMLSLNVAGCDTPQGVVQPGFAMAPSERAFQVSLW